MYGCDLLFSPETAKAVRAEVQSKLGGPCPCELDKRCPLLPDDLTEVLIPEQRPPAAAV